MRLSRPGSETMLVTARVAWAKVLSVGESGQLAYQVAVEFEAPIPEFMPVMEGAAPAAVAEAAPAQPVAASDKGRALALADRAAESIPATGPVAEPSLNRVLEATLKEAEERLGVLLREQAANREGWDAERAKYQQQVQEAVERTAGLQGTLEKREQEHADALVAQRTRFEALIAELVNNTNAQQLEYQELRAELTAGEEGHRRRTEEYEAELARRQEALDRQQSESDALVARLAAAEARCATIENRYRALLGDMRKLVAASAVDDEHSRGVDMQAVRAH